MGTGNENQKASNPAWEEGYDSIPRCLCGRMAWKKLGQNWHPCKDHLLLTRKEYQALKEKE